VLATIMKLREGQWPIYNRALLLPIPKTLPFHIFTAYAAEFNRFKREIGLNIVKTFGSYLTETNSMELSPSREAVSRSATQEFSQYLMELECSLPFHNSTLSVPIMSQINPVHTTPSYFLMIHTSEKTKHI
jgi:hypothetical protein